MLVIDSIPQVFYTDAQVAVAVRSAYPSSEKEIIWHYKGEVGPH